MPKVVEGNKFKIPPKLNFVWVTSEKTFKTKEDSSSKSIQSIPISVYIHNTKIAPKWSHTLWTNNINWISDDVEDQLKENKISLRSIDELHIVNPKHKALRNLLKKYTTDSNWGMASDIARDLVEYYEGGIYVDGGYEILIPSELEKYMKTYTSFFGINDFHANSRDFFEVINAFMASEAKGKIIEKKLALTYRNTIDIVKAPNYIKYPCNNFDETIFKTGPLTLTIAFDAEKEQSDTLLPYCSLFELPNDLLGCFNKTSLGIHHFGGTWKKRLRLKSVYIKLFILILTRKSQEHGLMD